MLNMPEYENLKFQINRWKNKASRGKNRLSNTFINICKLVFYSVSVKMLSKALIGRLSISVTLPGVAICNKHGDGHSTPLVKKWFLLSRNVWYSVHDVMISFYRNGARWIYISDAPNGEILCLTFDNITNALFLVKYKKKIHFTW